MLPKQRHEAILETLNKDGAARTFDLASRFEVTVETIRRDLEMMDNSGLVVRTHGGAIGRNHPTSEHSTFERKIVHLSDKRAIAERAVQFIQPRDTLFLDASSTVLQLAHQLPELELTVVTNSLDVLDVLENRRDIKLISTGGHYAKASRSFTGSLALLTTRRFLIQKFFFSGNGIDLERGISETSEEQAQLKCDLIPLAEKCFFLSDSTKLGHRAAYFFAKVDDVDTWITTQPENLEDIQAFRSHIKNIEVVSSSNPNPLQP